MEQMNVKINKTFLEKGIITIPNEFAKSILKIDDIKEKKTIPIQVQWKKNIYDISLRHAYRNDKTDYWHIDWRDCRKLIILLRKEFVQSYIKFKSKELLGDSEIVHAEEEAVSIKIKGKGKIEFSPYIKAETPYAALFKKLIDNNVFYWLNHTEDRSFILKSTEWIPISELGKHSTQEFVIYYLIDTKNKQLYIGSGKKLSDRVYKGREVIPEWDYFRYEIVKPMYHKHLKNIEYHSISNFARFLENNAGIKSLGKSFSDYKLVNIDCKGYWMRDK